MHILALLGEAADACNLSTDMLKKKKKTDG